MSKFPKKLNHAVFWPPFLLLLGAILLSIISPKQFHETVTAANDWILNHFDSAFSYTSFFMVLLSFTIMVSPLGKIKIGGKNANPLLPRTRWFAVILTTSVAVGILFWGTAEPLYHLQSPLELAGVDAENKNAIGFVMGTMFMHWSFTPYAIYVIPSLLFALAYYNHGKAFSLGSMLFPVFGKTNGYWFNTILNVLCLFALVAGMAASMGAGLLSLTGGLDRFFSFETNAINLGIIALFVVGAFTLSAASGLLKGIQWLSLINMSIFLFICLFFFAFGPSLAILQHTVTGVAHYINDFVPHSLSLGAYHNEPWQHSWTTFYWANWMAWAPITALFLGRLGIGYSVREFMLFNWVFPSLFSIIWMSIFSGSAVEQALDGTSDLMALLNESGPESIIYQMINAFPLKGLLTLMLLLAMFMSYVTAADSNTLAMSGLSSKGISPDDPEPANWIKFTWGITVGVTAWVMVSYAGIDGIKMLSNLGGLPALLLLILCSISAFLLLLNQWRKQS